MKELAKTVFAMPHMLQLPFQAGDYKPVEHHVGLRMSQGKQRHLEAVADAQVDHDLPLHVAAQAGQSLLVRIGPAGADGPPVLLHAPSQLFPTLQVILLRERMQGAWRSHLQFPRQLPHNPQAHAQLPSDPPVLVQRARPGMDP